MIDLLGLIKSAFVVVVATISILNPLSSPDQKSLNIPSITPSPVQEKSIIITPENPAINQGSTYQSNENKIIKTIPTSFPTPTIDPDPLVTCTSKTGNIRVKRSICSSYTDCPDGYGGYVFESQGSCKTRWDKISKDAANAAKAYGDSLIEKQKILNQQILQNQSSVSIPDYTTNLPQFTPVPTIHFEIKSPSPTPTPYFQCPGGGCANFSY